MPPLALVICLVAFMIPYIAEADEETCFLDVVLENPSNALNYGITWVVQHQQRFEFSFNTTGNTGPIALGGGFEPDWYAEPWYPYADLFFGSNYKTWNGPTVTEPGDYTLLDMTHEPDGTIVALQGVAIPSIGVTHYWMEVNTTHYIVGHKGEDPFLVYDRNGLPDEEWMLYKTRLVYEFGAKEWTGDTPIVGVKVCHMENAATGKSVRVNSCNAAFGHPKTCANQATDGDTQTCMVTGVSDQAYMTIDLGEAHYVTGISIYWRGLKERVDAGDIDYNNDLASIRAYISECPIRYTNHSMLTESESRCGPFDEGWGINNVLYLECSLRNVNVGRFIHVLPSKESNTDRVGLCEIVVHGEPLKDMVYFPDYYSGPGSENNSYVAPADEDADGVPDMCVEPSYPLNAHSVRAFVGGFIGKIIVKVPEDAYDWRVDLTFRRNIFDLELIDCDAKLADVHHNGKDKMHFTLEAKKEELKTLSAGDKLVIEFIAKTFKRARDVKFNAVFVPNSIVLL